MTAQAERRRRTAGAILDAAETVFASSGGYAAVTIEAVAREADVAVATIYDHFGGKQDVYLALARRLVELNEEYIEDAVSEPRSGIDEAVAIGEAYARFHLDHPLAFRLIGLADLDRASAERVGETHREIDRHLHSMLKVLTRALERAMAEGDVRQLDARRAAIVMWASINGVLAMHARGSLSRKDLRPALDLSRDMALRGLGDSLG